MVLGLSTFEAHPHPLSFSFFFSLTVSEPASLNFVTQSSLEVRLNQLRSAQLMGDWTR